MRKNCGEELAQLARVIHEWSLGESGQVRFGGDVRPRFGPTFSRDGSGARIFVIRIDGKLVFRFAEWRAMPWIDDRTILTGFRERLNKVPGLELSEDELGRKPIRSLHLLLPSTNLDLFKQAVIWLKQRTLSTGQYYHPDG